MAAIMLFYAFIHPIGIVISKINCDTIFMLTLNHSQFVLRGDVQLFNLLQAG